VAQADDFFEGAPRSALVSDWFLTFSQRWNHVVSDGNCVPADWEEGFFTRIPRLSD